MWAERPELADIFTILNLTDAGFAVGMIDEELQIGFGRAEVLCAHSSACRTASTTLSNVTDQGSSLFCFTTLWAPYQMMFSPLRPKR